MISELSIRISYPGGAFEGGGVAACGFASVVNETYQFGEYRGTSG